MAKNPMKPSWIQIIPRIKPVVPLPLPDPLLNIPPSSLCNLLTSAANRQQLKTHIPRGNNDKYPLTRTHWSGLACSGRVELLDQTGSCSEGGPGVLWSSSCRLHYKTAVLQESVPQTGCPPPAALLPDRSHWRYVWLLWAPAAVGPVGWSGEQVDFVPLAVPPTLSFVATTIWL